MKYFFLAVALSLSLTGCYTMLYPPPSEMAGVYRTEGAVVTIPDSLAGQGITIINQNQNQIIFDRYYQDPYYQRDGYRGGSAYWDPYYYDSRRNHRRYYWQHGRYYPDDSPRPTPPKQKTPRRDKDYRQSGELPSIPAQPTEPVNVRALRPAVPIGQPTPVQPEATEPAHTSAAQVVNANDNDKALKVAPEANPPEEKKKSESKNSSKESKSTRRGNTRER